MKKMVKVILVCAAVLCAIDQIMRFTGPYAIAHIWNDIVLDGNYAAADAINAKINSKYCKRDQKVFEIFTDCFASLGEKMRNC